MGYATVYRKKCLFADDAVQLVRDGDIIVVPSAAAEPDLLLTALSNQRHSFRSVKVLQVLPLKRYEYYDPATFDHVHHVGIFLGPASRSGAQEGWADYLPGNFSEVPVILRRGLYPADVVFTYASPMDSHGFFSLGLAADYTMAAITKARVVVLEVNPNIPFCYGNCHVHISQVTGIVNSEGPLFEVGLPKIGPIQEAIGKYVADLIPDGSTLQIGYGGIPDAVVMQLTEKKDIGIHTELMGDGILRLIEAGVVTNRRKNINPGKNLATFALGSRKLYDFMNRNLAFEMHPCDYTNDPALAGLNNNLVAVNATLQVDLIGQCGSENFGVLPFSGTGGQADFVRAANRSEGGKAIIVLPSTAKGDTVSRIVPTLPEGTHISTSKNDVNYIVTEYGVAQLRGKSAKQRAEALINIAHPDFRENLRASARHMKLL